MLAIGSLEAFVADYIDGLLAGGRLRLWYKSRREPDPWEGRQEDEQKVIAWLLRPETDRMLREKRAAYPVKYPSNAAERLEELRWRFYGPAEAT
jgi:hypothetical protein